MHDELTANDIKKMEDEIEYRKLVVRKKALDDVKVARAQGDLSENFEYKAAKQFKNQNESRIRYLEKMIKTAVVISDESNDDEVGMFNTVDVYFEDDDETETYKIVTTVRGNSLKNLISKESPLGAAIFHPRRGADLPRQRAKEKVVTAKTAPRDIRGVTQGQRQLRTAANETVRSITTQAQMQTRTRQVQLAIQKAASSTCKTAVAVRS